MALMRNAEFTDIARKTALLFIAAAAAFCVLLAIQAESLHQGLVDRTASAIGRLIALHPEDEGEIVLAAQRDATAADRERGEAALSAWGYGAGSALGANPLLRSLLPGMVASQLAFGAALASAVFLLLSRGYRTIYRKIGEISDAAEKVVDGRSEVLLPASGEGEFAVLGHRFNQMANRLKLNMEQLTAEKIFLKNIISDISHQLKTPLASLVLYNDLMAADGSMDEAHRKSFLELSRQQLQRLEWLIQSLLKMARLEAGSIAFRNEPVDLGEVAGLSVAALGPMAAEAGVSIAVRELHGGARIHGDADWLAEALINVLKNGIEHSRRGGAVEVALDHTALTASIAVADRGEGIDRAELPHIFDRFYRSSRSVKPNSIGIGLAMAKAIVEGQGGTISVRSEKGKGSEFTITFLKKMGE